MIELKILNINQTSWIDNNQLLNMGSSLNSDKNAQIYVRLEKTVYYAGETVQGFVYINCTMNRPYQNLYIRLEGEENCQWTEGHGKHSATYSNHRKTYEDQYILSNLYGNLMVGRFQFPFSFLLPVSLTSSLSMGYRNYITYKIIAYLNPATSNAERQAFERIVHIREPQRALLGPIKSNVMAEVNCCCNCCECECCKYGMVGLDYEVSNSFLSTGTNLQIRGRVDNTQGTIDIKGYKIALIQKNKKVSEFGRQYYYETELCVFAEYNKVIQRGEIDEFNTGIRLGQQFGLEYTAIGNILYRSYEIRLIANLGCCISDNFASSYIHLDSRLVSVEQLQSEEPIDLNNCMPANKIVFLNLRPYVFRPQLGIEISNQTGFTIPKPPLFYPNNDIVGSSDINLNVIK